MSRQRVASAVAAMIVATSAFTGVANAAKAEPVAPPPTVLPAGLVCAFPLEIQASAVAYQNPKNVYDAAGKLVGYKTTGKGVDLTFTNLDTGATYLVKGNGSNLFTTINADGTQTVVGTGHNVIGLFPTDQPAGPSLTQYIGRIEYLSDPTPPDYPTVVTNFTGRTVDICAKLTAT